MFIRGGRRKIGDHARALELNLLYMPPLLLFLLVHCVQLRDRGRSAHSEALISRVLFSTIAVLLSPASSFEMGKI